jgi:hypothetical protein
MGAILWQVVHQKAKNSTNWGLPEASCTEPGSVASSSVFIANGSVGAGISCVGNTEAVDCCVALAVGGKEACDTVELTSGVFSSCEGIASVGDVDCTDLVSSTGISVAGELLQLARETNPAIVTTTRLNQRI